MADQSNDWPEEGELVVCSVKSVKENGAYLSLDTYPEREGFVFIGEIATGWVRNIRAHVREGQRLVAKVIGVKKDRDSITLSIKSVSEERRRDDEKSIILIIDFKLYGYGFAAVSYTHLTLPTKA